ncbi:uncharacterized protein [Mytilus edulis]|uniref:uncharacterized protein n=1 Tax=Mytilus edulis TaxID=6550 RepID=UPI0039EF9C80
MNGNAINQDNDDDESLFAMRKVTYWDIYGVKRFPYRGKRKFTPLLSQSLDGAMTISNDVFGLTIKQFERMYKACLDRRKTQEPWITNLRYPDKSSNEYLEYLQNCTDCNTDHLLWLGKDLRDKYLYEHLVETIGTEIEIRTRQRLFIIKDMINNAYPTQRPHISSGSLSEGLNLPGSDIDIMYVVHEFEVVQNARNIKHPIKHSICVLETDVDHPGFTRLIAVKTNDVKKCSRQQCNYCRCTDTRQFHVALSLTDFVLSRCSPDMVFQCDEPSCGHRIMYSQNVHSSITLNERMKMAIIRYVRYCKNSSLIPKELQLEVEKYRIDIPPVIMSYCLRFLCYHHLGDIFNRQQSLRDLFSTVKRKYLIKISDLSNSITILGVCYEISGAKDRAYQCYEEALQVDDTISKTAKIRKSKLLL